MDNLNKLWQIVEDRELRVLQSMRSQVGPNLVTEQEQQQQQQHTNILFM